MLHAVIMAGGSGTRFWPASRADRPKQLLPLAGERTMLQDTLHRLDGLVPPDRVLVMTNERLAEPIARQLPELPRGAILGEPCKRDTAPCVGWAASLLARRDPQATMLVMPSDHVIAPVEKFQSAVRRAVAMVEDDPTLFVTFGIRPSYPAETFGYIERGDRLGLGEPLVARVARFREKPKAHVAAQFIESGNFYWNAGIFVWKAGAVFEAIQRQEPEMARHLQAIADASDSPQAEATLRREFEAIKGKSIDYAVMEHYSNVAVIEAPFAWDDLGSWQALPRLRGTDSDGNTAIGRHLGLRTRGTIVSGDPQHLIVTVGMEDCIIVHTPDATLVAKRSEEEAIREVVKTIEQRGWKEHL